MIEQLAQPGLDPGTLSIYDKYAIVHETDGMLIDLLENEFVPGGTSFAYLYSLTHLPEGLETEGYLDLSYCVSLTHLPTDLKVGGYLNLTKNQRYLLKSETKMPIFIQIN